MTRVLITGASGLLGSNLVLLRPAWWEVIALTNAHPIGHPPTGVTCAQVDLLASSVDRALATFLPLDTIIHTAALTDVDRCERDPALATALNTTLAADVAAFAARHHIHLVHISTDHVFDGMTGGYAEDAPVHPVNTYAATKAEAEARVAAAGGSAAIVRTNFFGANLQEKEDLAGWMRQQFASRGSVRLFRDVRCSPIFAPALVSAFVEIVERRVMGVLHVAASDGCSKEEFGRMLAAVFHLDSTRIVPVSVDDAGLAVRRPKDMTLDTRRARSLLTTSLPTIAQSIEWYRQFIAIGYHHALRAMAGMSARVVASVC